MADLDRISELLFSDEEMPDVYYSLLENARGTEPTLDPNSLEALLANRQDQSQDDFLMNMAMFLGPGKFLGPGNIKALKQVASIGLRPPSKGAARQVSRQPYYPKEAKNIPEGLTRASKTFSGRPYSGPTRSVEEGLGSLIPVRKNLLKGSREHKWYIDPKTGELFEYNYGSGAWARGFYKRGAQSQNTPAYARKAREDFIPPLTQTGRNITTPAPTLATLYQKALDRIRKSEELARDTIGMRNPTGQLREADAIKAAALREIERIRKAGGGKLPNLMPDKLTTEQIQQAMREAGLGSLFKP